MAHRTAYFHRYRAALPVVAAALLGLAACVSEMPDPAALSDVGVLEGVVTEAGLPVPARIRFRDAMNDADVNAEVMADSSGWYRVELPIGAYKASLSMDQSWPSSDDVDTVSVGRAVRRKDFPRGRARVTVALPSELQGTNANLRLQHGNFRSSQRADVIDSVATFDFRLMPPLAFIMRLATGNASTNVLLPGTYFEESADSLRVGTGDVSHVADLRPMHISVSGRVTGSWQLENGRMWVEAVMPFGGTRTEVECEPDGSFSFHLFAPERTRFRSRCDNSTLWFGGTSFSTATAYDLQAGDRLSGLALAEGGLRIRTNGTGSISNRSAYFDLYDSRGYYRSLRIENRQPYLLSNLAAGSYRLKVVGFCAGDPWLSQWYQGAATEAEATLLEVVPGAFTEVNITLQTAGALSGIMVEEDGDIGSIGSIYVHDQEGASLCSVPSYLGPGRFMVAGLPDGDYYLRIWYNDTQWWYPGTYDFALATRLTVAGADTVANLVWTVPESEDWVFP
ncbi:MAG: hypothetical protein IPH48_17090 [bacterium]|nr:hypothetical protein [bacterium]